MDISPDPHSDVMDPQAPTSFSRARELFDSELLKGRYPSLRRGESTSFVASASLPTSVSTSACTSAATSHSTLPDTTEDRADLAGRLLYLVEERPCSTPSSESGQREHPSTPVGPEKEIQPGQTKSELGTETETETAGAGAVEDNYLVVSPSTGKILPYPWVAPRSSSSAGAGRNGGGIDDHDSSMQAAAAATFSDGMCSNVHTDVGSGRISTDDVAGDMGNVAREGIGSGRKYGNAMNSTIPYWAILTVDNDKWDSMNSYRRSWLFRADETQTDLGVSSTAHGDAVEAMGDESGSMLRRPVQNSLMMSPSPTRTVPQRSAPPRSQSLVGYRVVVMDVRVSVYHPEGSDVAASKDAVILGLVKVRGKKRLQSLLFAKVYTCDRKCSSVAFLLSS